MSYEVYRYIFIGAAILCGIMFIVSVFLFILLKISESGGRAAKKAEKKIRKQPNPERNKYDKTVALDDQVIGGLDDGVCGETSAIDTADAMFAIEYEITYIHSNEII